MTDFNSNLSFAVCPLCDLAGRPLSPVSLFSKTVITIVFLCKLSENLICWAFDNSGHTAHRSAKELQCFVANCTLCLRLDSLEADLETKIQVKRIIKK